jgi:hypothetical protein
VIRTGDALVDRQQNLAQRGSRKQHNFGGRHEKAAPGEPHDSAIEVADDEYRRCRAMSRRHHDRTTRHRLVRQIGSFALVIVGEIAASFAYVGANSPRDGPTSSFRNCAETRAAEAAPIHGGQPGYAAHLHADRDGIACEPGVQRPAGGLLGVPALGSGRCSNRRRRACAAGRCQCAGSF